MATTTPKLRVTLVTVDPVLATGGPAKTVREVAEALDASVVAFLRPSVAGQRLTLSPAVTAPTRGGRFLEKLAVPRPGRELEDAERQLRRSDVVFIHSFFLGHALWASRICRRHAIPYVIVPHGIFDPWAMARSRWVKQAFLMLGGRRVLAHATAFLCATRREGEKAAPWIGTQRTQVVNWASPLPEVLPGELRTAWRSKLGLAPDAFVMVCLGRLHPMKRVDAALEAAAGSGVSGAQLLVAGPEEGLTAEELSRKARELGFAGLRYLGVVSGVEKWGLLAASDLYLSLSWRENFNHTAVEALAMECPVLLSPGNDLAGEEGFRDVGFQLEDTAVAGAAERVRAIAALPRAELRAMGSRGRTWVAQAFSRPKFAERLQAVVNSVASGKSP